MPGAPQYPLANTQPPQHEEPVCPLIFQSAQSIGYSYTSSPVRLDWTPAAELFHAFDTTIDFGSAHNYSLIAQNQTPLHHTIGSAHPYSDHFQENKQEEQLQTVLSRHITLAAARNGETGASGSKAAKNTADDGGKTLTAKFKRKAQNRAAQRAFRLRKEQHVKALEAELESLQVAQQNLLTENERLKLKIQKMSTEIEALRAVPAIINGSLGSCSPPTLLRHDHDNCGPHASQQYQFKPVSWCGATAAPQHKLLEVGPAWDFIVSHDLFKRGVVNVAKVRELLQYRAHSGSRGPVFELEDIVNAIEQSASGSSDELL